MPKPVRFLTTILPALLLFGMVVLVLVNVLRYSPYVDPDKYDVSNTYRVSLLAPSDIVDVLNNEQNFYTYYFILHFLFKNLGASVTVVALINFILWLVSLMLMRKILTKSFPNSPYLLWYLFFFAAIPGVFYYATAFRMYLLILLAQLLHFLVFSHYCNTEQTKYLYFSGAVLLFMALMHPATLIYVVLSFIIYAVVMSRRTHFLVVLLTHCFALLVVVYQIVLRDTFLSVYLFRGLDYLDYSSVWFVSAPNLLLSKFQNRFVLDVSFYVFYISSTLGFVYRYLIVPLKQGTKPNTQKMYLLVFSICYFFAHVLFPKYFSSRHTIFFIFPLVLVLVYFVEDSFGRLKDYLLMYLALFFIVLGFPYLISTLRISEKLKGFCEIAPAHGVVVADYASLNYLSYCLSNKSIDLYIYDGEHSFDFYNSANTLTKPVLLKQAVMGGSYKMFFLVHNKNLDTKIRHSLQTIRIKDSLPLDTENIYLYNSLFAHTNTLYDYELNVFEGYTLENSSSHTPYFIFKKKSDNL